MAKAVSQAFKDHWTKKHGQKVVLSTQIQKRYQATPTSFVYTGVWEELDQGLHVREYPRMTKALDYPFKNIFKTATITVSVPNLNNEWIPTATAPSIFAGDAVAPDGYFAPLTKFRFRLGYILPDGTQEFTDQFTGFLLDIKPKGSSPYADLIMASSMHVFEDLEIENIVDTFVLEDAQPAVGDGTINDFLSTSKGVKRLTEVQVDAVPVNQGDYQIDNIDDIDEVKLNIRSAPPAGQTVKQSGEKWKQEIKIEDAVALIFDEAGIAPADRQIDPAIFSGVAASRSWDLKTEWDAGTLTSIDSQTVEGSIVQSWNLIDDFADGDFTTFRTWTNGFSNFTGWSAASFALAGSNPTRDLYLSNVTGDVGTWEFKMTRSVGSIDFGFSSINDSGFFINPPARLKYWIRISGATFRLYRGDDAPTPSDPATEFLLATVAHVPTGTEVYRVSRDADGEMKAYIDGVLQFTVTDTENAGSVIRIRFPSTGTGTVDEIHHTQIAIDEAHIVTPSNWESEVIDIGGVPTAWGTLDRFDVVTGAAVILYETFSSDTVDFTVGNDPAGWVAIGGSGQVLSELKQFVKVRAIVTVDRLIETAQINKLTLNFQVSTITLSVAIFSGKDGIKQLEQFARLVNYQLGAEDGGLTFFRAPSSAGSVMTLTQENAIIDVLDWSPGWDRVKNIGSVRYGNYTAVYDKDSAGEVEPTSQRRFGKKIASDNLTDLLLANDVQLGAARAQVLYEDLVEPKRRLIIQAWFVPWLELSDVITIDYFDHPILKAFFWYDPLQAWGGDFFSMDDSQNNLARSLDMRILEIDQDPVNPTTGGGITAKYTLEEILS